VKATRRTLDEIAAELPRTDKGRDGHDYCVAYEQHLGHLRDEAAYLLEVGVWDGDSLRMWEQWAEDWEIIGLDIEPREQVNTERVKTIVANVCDWDPDGYLFDVVIDDGSHKGWDVVSAHARLWPRLVPGGFYCIEDWAVIGEPASGAIASIFRQLLASTLNGQKGEVASLHVYDQLVIMQKRL
jgi:hypothetical protein